MDYLICNCLECNYLIENKPIFANPNCLNHFFRILDSIKLKRIQTIQLNTKYNKYILDNDQIRILKNYLDQTKKITSNLSIEKLRPRSINCKNFKDCEKRIILFLNRVIGQSIEDGAIYRTPIHSYKEIKLEISLHSKEEIKPECQKCISEYVKFLKFAVGLLENTIIIRGYSILKPDLKRNSDEELINYIIGELMSIYEFEINDDSFCKFKNIIDKYNVGPFNISIFDSDKDIENYYHVEWKSLSDDLLITIDWLITELKNWKPEELTNSFLNFNDILNLKIKRVKDLLDKCSLNIENLDIDELILLVVFKSMSFPLLFSLLIDDQIEEIFIDRLGTPIYLDHRIYGRCKTNIYLSNEELRKFITRVRIESNSPLDEVHPSIKTDIITDFFQIRVTIISKPIATDNYIIIIRKLRKKAFSILELIKNNTISIEAAAYLIFALFHKRNIVVIGAPGSGKTTLINALDVITPDHWRKIYIEDVIESIDQKNLSKHQVRISIKSFLGDFNQYNSKEFQVRESLHRTPDMIYLGEMISKNAVQAFFFLLKVGLRCGLCTCHGEDPELMLRRWMIEDNISPNSIQDLDLIVQISKTNDINGINRRVIKISEVSLANNNELKLINTFIRDPKLDILRFNFNRWLDLYENSPMIKKINNAKIEHITTDIFLREIEMFQEILLFLLTNDILDNITLNKVFNKFLIWYKKYNLVDWNSIKNSIFKELDL
ncbi:MAG: ATPase, T2SS/T4P/T4SS family [Candidatus Helarchaeota archaeon]